jgi:murein DD-endopeptidase MepM/ murein hydrolase activator NlpD
MLIVITSLVLSAACPAVSPVQDPIVVARPFGPVGRYAGHWGLDLAADLGTEVRVVAGGIVTFVGVVGGTRSVTVDHGGGLRSSYSYLAGASVTLGPVAGGEVIGRSGDDHGVAALHLSVRIGDRYVDPTMMLHCETGPPGDALGLLPGGAQPSRRGDNGTALYPGQRASRHSWRHLRSSPHRSPGGG